MDMDKSHYEESWRSEKGDIVVYNKKRELVSEDEEEEIWQNFSRAYRRLFDGLTPMQKFEFFERDGCEALIDGEFVKVNREYYIKALGLEGKVI